MISLRICTDYGGLHQDTEDNSRCSSLRDNTACDRGNKKYQQLTEVAVAATGPVSVGLQCSTTFEGAGRPMSVDRMLGTKLPCSNNLRRIQDN
jgi:hypothetical protein